MKKLFWLFILLFILNISLCCSAGHDPMNYFKEVAFEDYLEDTGQTQEGGLSPGMIVIAIILASPMVAFGGYYLFLVVTHRKNKQ